MLLPQQDQLVEYWLSGPAALSCADMGCHFSIQETNRQRKGSPWGERLSARQGGGKPGRAGGYRLEVGS